ncbi:MAG TPA: outer membrane beta-barrel protein [Nannocystaceae bacterium]|nr:outer membrane beta-barrel protein [Nannocystaceae bacterium]
MASHEPEAQPQPSTSTPIEPPTDDAPSAPPPVERTASPSPPAPRWYEALTIGAFADAYAQVNWSFPSPQTQNTRGNDNMIGFALGWAGANLAYDNGVVGGTIQLRFGPRVQRYNLTDASNVGLAMRYVKQAYATWKPKLAKGRLAFDFGKWDSTFGADNGDSYLNMNYSWPFLYWYGQPFFHTGLRMSAQLVERLGLTLFVANGWNNTQDNNGGKTFGAQLVGTPRDEVTLVLGYMTGPEGEAHIDVVCAPDTAFDAGSGRCVAMAGAAGETHHLGQRRVNRRFRHFVDLVLLADLHPKLRLAFNADVGLDQQITNPVTGGFRNVQWYGATLALRYAFAQKWAAAARADVIRDAEGFDTGVNKLVVGSGTLTFDYSPMPALTIRLENRLDGANQAYFPRRPSDLRRYQVTSLVAVNIMMPKLF